MNREPRRRKIWSNEELARVAKLCTTKKEFERRFNSAYVLSAKRGIRAAITTHMIEVYERRTVQGVLELARKYSSLKDFKAQRPNDYAYMVRSHNLVALSQEFMPANTGIGHHLVYRYDFPDGIYLGISCSVDKREKFHVRRGAVAKHMKRTGHSLPPIKVLYDTLMPQEAALLEKKLIEDFRKENLPLLNVSGGGQLGAFGRTVWTKEKVQRIALKYHTRKDFQYAESAAYKAACKNSWREEVCTHMEVKRRIFTDEKIRAIAAQYSTRGEFLKKDHACYGAAKSRGILEEVCSHMKRVRRRG